MSENTPGQTLVSKTKSMDARIGGLVRARRKFLGVSQEKLAQALGLTFQQVQKYERGGNRIAASTLCLIADVLECPVTTFLADLDPAAVPVRLEKDPALVLATDSFGRRLAAAYARLPDRQRPHAVRIIEAMIDDAAEAA